MPLENYLDSFERRLVHPAAAEDAFARGRCISALATRGLEKAHWVHGNGIPKWNYAPKGFRLQ